MECLGFKTNLDEMMSDELFLSRLSSELSTHAEGGTSQAGAVAGGCLGHGEATSVGPKSKQSSQVGQVGCHLFLFAAGSSLTHGYTTDWRTE